MINTLLSTRLPTQQLCSAHWALTKGSHSDITCTFLSTELYFFPSSNNSSYSSPHSQTPIRKSQEGALLASSSFKWRKPKHRRKVPSPLWVWCTLHQWYGKLTPNSSQGHEKTLPQKHHHGGHPGELQLTVLPKPTLLPPALSTTHSFNLCATTTHTAPQHNKSGKQTSASKINPVFQRPPF